MSERQNVSPSKIPVKSDTVCVVIKECRGNIFSILRTGHIQGAAQQSSRRNILDPVPQSCEKKTRRFERLVNELKIVPLPKLTNLQQIPSNIF